MKKYEILLMLPIHTGAELQQADTSAFETALTKQGGKILHRTDMGRRFLGYIVKKTKEAQIVSFDFELSPDKINELRRALLLEEGILKFTLIVKPKIGFPAPEKPRVVHRTPPPHREPMRSTTHHGS